MLYTQPGRRPATLPDLAPEGPFITGAQEDSLALPGAFGEPPRAAPYEPPPVEQHLAGAQEPETQSHLQTWHVFSHLVIWFAIHVMIDLIGVYFFVAEGNVAAGLFFIALGTATLFGAIVAVPTVLKRRYSH